MAIVQDIRVGIAQGIRVGINPSSGPAVPRDGPGSVFLPRDATDWTELGLNVPDGQLNCADASGALTPAIGAVSWAAGGAGHLYQQAVTGWSVPFCGMPEGSSLRWSTTDASLDLAAGQSFVIGGYFSFAAASAGNRMLFQAQGATDLVRATTTGVPSTLHNNVITAFAGNHAGLTVVRPIFWFRNGTTNVSGCKTDLQEVTGTHDESARSGVARSIGSNGSTGLALRCCLLAWWKAANAEFDLKAMLQTLAWTLSY